MAPGPSTEQRLSTEERSLLLRIASESILHGLEQGKALQPDPRDFPPALGETRASFVTLHLMERLRGCIGTLKAGQPLVCDVAGNAYAAAFRDPRFQPLTNAEFAGLTVHISVLGVPEPFPCASEAQLLEELRPGIDGLIIREGTRSATFLPAVWESLAEPEEFVRQLKMKAGMPPDYWSENLIVERYTTESFC